LKNLLSIEDLKLSKENTVVYFYKPEINYHEKFHKMMESIEKDFSIEVCTVDVRSDPTIPKRFDFISLPCVALFKKQKLVKKHEGMISYPSLKKLFRLKKD